MKDLMVKRSIEVSKLKDELIAWKGDK